MAYAGGGVDPAGQHHTTERHSSPSGPDCGLGVIEHKRTHHQSVAQALCVEATSGGLRFRVLKARVRTSLSPPRNSFESSTP